MSLRKQRSAFDQVSEFDRGRIVAYRDCGLSFRKSVVVLDETKQLFGEGERLAQRSNLSIVFTDRVFGEKAIFESSAAIEFIFEAVPRVNSRLVKLTTLIVRVKKQCCD
ncbi:hypothetical protein TNCV_1855901 [Trichonephila clavipes]|nr:hypothetical protein TNCV_1855901 [Trichonephila clavipes]